MKSNKLFLTVPLLFFLSSCQGNESLVGTYTFQLGASDSTHVGITFDLTNEDYSSVEGAKKYSLTFDIGGTIFGAFSALEDASNGEESSSDVDSEEVSIEGYYTIHPQEDGTKLLSLGVTILGEELAIPPEITDKIMYATINDNEIDVVIPVSIKDLQYQIYWYGYRVSNILDAIVPINLMEEDREFFTDLYQGKNTIGTHPNAEQVAKIKEYQKERKETASDYDTDGEDTFLTYFNYHTIKMGFIK